MINPYRIKSITFFNMKYLIQTDSSYIKTIFIYLSKAVDVVRTIFTYFSKVVDVVKTIFTYFSKAVDVV